MENENEQAAAEIAPRARQAALMPVLKILRDIERRAAAGEDVYGEMASRIQARSEANIFLDVIVPKG